MKKNVVMKGLSGMLADQVVVRQDKAGRSIIRVKPAFAEDREFSPGQ